jgi:hypothetical protein
VFGGLRRPVLADRICTDFAAVLLRMFAEDPEGYMPYTHVT